MALKELFNHYYKINAEKTACKDAILNVAFTVYESEEERLKEKRMLPLFQSAKQTLESLLSNAQEKDLQDLCNLDNALYYALYEKTSHCYKELAINAINNLDLLTELIPYIENPVKTLYTAEIKCYNYDIANPTVSDAYNVLKTRIGKSTDV